MVRPAFILSPRTAQEAAACHLRQQMAITGRLQSRDYTKLTENGPENRTTYEISALTMTLPENSAPA